MTASGNLLHEKLSFAVIGCAQKVHRSLGPGFPESVYQKALGYELQEADIPFQVEAQFEVEYEDMVCGRFRVDFFVDHRIILELKALDSLCKQHEAQLLAYLKATGCKVGLLLNFGEASLRQRRFIL